MDFAVIVDRNGTVTIHLPIFRKAFPAQFIPDGVYTQVVLRTLFERRGSAFEHQIVPWLKVLRLTAQLQGFVKLIFQSTHRCKMIEASVVMQEMLVV